MSSKKDLQFFTKHFTFGEKCHRVSFKSACILILQYTENINFSIFILVLRFFIFLLIHKYPLNFNIKPVTCHLCICFSFLYLSVCYKVPLNTIKLAGLMRYRI